MLLFASCREFTGLETLKVGSKFDLKSEAKWFNWDMVKSNKEYTTYKLECSINKEYITVSTADAIILSIEVQE